MAILAAGGGRVRAVPEIGGTGARMTALSGAIKAEAIASAMAGAVYAARRAPASVLPAGGPAGSHDSRRHRE
jgi:hypothetical protein